MKTNGWTWCVVDLRPLSKSKHAFNLDSDDTQLKSACGSRFPRDLIDPHSATKVIMCVRCLIIVGEGISLADDNRHRGS